LGFSAEAISSAVNLKYRYRNSVVCSELTFAAELCVLQRIWDSLSKLNCL
jgi:hypothetical protein